MKLTLYRILLPASICFALLAGCAQEKPEALLGSAKNYLAKHDSKAAIIQLKNALQKEPGLAEARFLLGRTLLEGGEAAAAEIELRKALDLQYPQAEVLPVLARALVLEGKGQRAILEYAATELDDPQAMAELKMALATAYVQQGNKLKAQEALEESLQAVPDFGPALLMQARLAAAAQQFDAAFEFIERILAGDPASHETLQLKGDLLFFAKGDVAAALQAQRKALALRQDFLPAHVSIMQVLLTRRDLAAAKTQLEGMKKVLPGHAQTRYFEAQLAFLNGDAKAAREMVQQLLKIAPDNVQVLVLAGTIELQAHSLGQAESLIAKARRIAPDIPVARMLLAQIYLANGQAPKAQEMLAPLLENPDVGAEALGLAAQAALQSGDGKTAEKYFSRALKLDPTDMRSRTALALSQFSKGKVDLAYAQLEDIASADSGTIADMALISARLRERNYDAALKAIDKMERKRPDEPFASQLRGQVYLARKDFTAARQAFAKALTSNPSYFPAAANLAALDLRDKKPEEARKHFDKLLSVDPKNVHALLAIADLRAQAGASSDELAGLFTNAIKVNPTAVAPRLRLVELRLRTKNAKAALTEAQEGVAAVPDNPELLDALGRAQMASGDINQAITSFSKVVALQRRSPRPYMHLASAYEAQKNIPAARESLNRAIEVAPKFLPAQRALVTLELSAGRPDQAMAVAHMVQTERPNQAAGYLLAGDIDAIRKNWDAAAAAYRAGLKRRASSELASKLYAVLRSAQRRTEADSFAAGWVKQHPADVSFQTFLGDVALAQHDLTAAESHYRAVVQLQPENAGALNSLAWVTYRLKKPGAVALAEKANALRPGEPVLMDTLARLLAEDGQLAKALELEKKAVALAPEHHAYRLNLAKLYLKSGDKARARAELDQLAKLGDSFPKQAEVGQLLKAF